MTGTPSESAAFLQYLADPRSGPLVALLRAHQDRVFRLCYQVLHHRQDAEDAAQEVLLKIPGDIRRFSDHDSFRRWLNRVSLNAALEMSRKTARRRAHHLRAAMNQPLPEPPDPSDRLAIFEALSSLGEGEKALLLEHYFEGEALDSIAAREGTTAPTICRRLDGAREALRRRLSGVLAAIPIEAMFVRAPSAPDLVTGAVLAKAAAVGGTIMTAKASVGVTVAIAVACLVAGSGAGAWMAARSGKHEVENLKRRLASVEKGPLKTGPVPEAMVTPAEKAQHLSPVATAPETVGSKLQAKLARYRSWIEVYRREHNDIAKRDPNNLAAFQARSMADLGEILIGLRDLVCASPAEFLQFLSDPQNEPYLGTLIIRGLGFYVTDSRSSPQQFRDFPRELLDGMLHLLNGGGYQRKMSLLRFFELIHDQPQEFKAFYPQMLSEGEYSLQIQVVHTIAHTGSWTDEAFKAVTELGQTAIHSDLRMAISNSMAWVMRPEAVTYLVDRLGSTTDYNEAIAASQTLTMRLRNDITLGRGRASPELEDKLAQAVAQGLTRGFDGATFLTVLRAGLWLPSEKLKPLLHQAAGLAPTDHSRKAVARLSELAGNSTATGDEMLKASW